MRTDLTPVECWEISYITTKILSDSADAHQAAVRLLHLIGTRMEATFAGFWVLDGLEPGLRCAAVWPDHGPQQSFAIVTKARIFRLGEGLPGTAWERRNVIWERDVTISTNFPRASVARLAGLKTGIAFPAYAPNSTLAAIEIFGQEVHDPSGPLVEFFQALGGQIGLFLKHFHMPETLSDASGEFQMVADASKDVVLTIDESSTILFANTAVFLALGYQPEELIGHNLAEIIPERLREQHKAGMARYLRTREKALDWNEIRLPARHKMGGEIMLKLAFGEFWRSGKKVFTGFAKII